MVVVVILQVVMARTPAPQAARVGLEGKAKRKAKRVSTAINPS
jgi:hypothetical protein